MAGLRKPELASRFSRCLTESGAVIRRVDWAEGRVGKLPWSCELDLVGVVHAFRCYFWTVTHGGNHRSNSEYRIQTMVTSEDRRLGFGGSTTVLLGLYDPSLDEVGPLLGHRLEREASVIVAWDPVRHIKLGVSSSCQVQFDQIDEAYLKGTDIRRRPVRDGETETVVAMRPEYLASYFALALLGHESADTTRLVSRLR